MINYRAYAATVRQMAAAQRSVDAMEPPDYGEFKCRYCCDIEGGCEECDGKKRCIGDDDFLCDDCGNCKEESDA